MSDKQIIGAYDLQATAYLYFVGQGNEDKEMAGDVKSWISIDSHSRK